LDKIIDLKVSDLKIFNDDRGSLLHILSSSKEPEFIFGECYASETKPGVIKAWKKHQEVSQNICVIEGEVKLVIIDLRSSSKTYNIVNEIYLSRDNYKLVHIPKELWYGFKCVSKSKSIIINCIDKPYDKEETVSCSIDELPFKYEW
tara:strand:- start:107 stop:547 length:441 start_codon:yes stop_codon:yes gene_type:complete